MSIDIEDQLLVAEQVYKVKCSNREEEVVTKQQLSLTYFYEEQIRALLNECGFKIVEFFSGFHEEKPQVGNEMVLVCKKK